MLMCIRVLSAESASNFMECNNERPWREDPRDRGRGAGFEQRERRQDAA